MVEVILMFVNLNLKDIFEALKELTPPGLIHTVCLFHVRISP